MWHRNTCIHYAYITEKKCFNNIRISKHENALAEIAFFTVSANGKVIFINVIPLTWSTNIVNMEWELLTFYTGYLLSGFR